MRQTNLRTRLDENPAIAVERVTCFSKSSASIKTVRAKLHPQDVSNFRYGGCDNINASHKQPFQ
jgi:hypothetical protein